MSGNRPRRLYIVSGNSCRYCLVLHRPSDRAEKCVWLRRAGRMCAAMFRAHLQPLYNNNPNRAARLPTFDRRRACFRECPGSRCVHCAHVSAHAVDMCMRARFAGWRAGAIWHAGGLLQAHIYQARKHAKRMSLDDPPPLPYLVVVLLQPGVRTCALLVLVHLEFHLPGPLLHVQT